MNRISTQNQTSIVPRIESVVKDTEFSILENVHVYFKNNPRFGATTNNEGFFSIPMTNPKEDVLVFSHQGMTTEIPVRSITKVTILDTTVGLDEVVLNSKEKKHSCIWWFVGGLLAGGTLTWALKGGKKTVKARL